MRRNLGIGRGTDRRAPAQLLRSSEAHLIAFLSALLLRNELAVHAFSTRFPLPADLLSAPLREPLSHSAGASVQRAFQRASRIVVFEAFVVL